MDEDKDGGDGCPGSGDGTGSRAPTPPAPTSVPVRRPFTAEDTVNLGCSTGERKDDDLSLIVHVDDTLDNDTLDNDILGTPLRNASNDPDLIQDATKDVGNDAVEEDAADKATPAGGASTESKVPAANSDGASAAGSVAASAPDSGEDKENSAATTTPAPASSSVAATSSSSAAATTSDQTQKKEDAKSAPEAKNEGSEKTKRLVCIKPADAPAEWQAVSCWS